MSTMKPVWKWNGMSVYSNRTDMSIIERQIPSAGGEFATKTFPMQFGFYMDALHKTFPRFD